MADIVINHSSARGLWFKNFLKRKKPGKDYFLTVNSKFNTSKVVRPRDHKLQKNLKKYFDTIHFLPFYPSSSDSGFAVKDHYKVENKLGNWLDIKNVSKSSNVMADMVINHSSARGLWFKNFLKKKRTWKGFFFDSRLKI